MKKQMLTIVLLVLIICPAIAWGRKSKPSSLLLDVAVDKPIMLADQKQTAYIRIALEGFVPEKIDELLNLKELNLKSVLMLPVGYRAEDDIMSEMQKVRKPLSETIIEIS